MLSQAQSLIIDKRSMQVVVGMFLRNVETRQADYGTARLFVFDSVHSQPIKIRVAAKKKNALASQSVSHCNVVMTLQRSDIENDKITSVI